MFTTGFSMVLSPLTRWSWTTGETSSENGELDNSSLEPSNLQHLAGTTESREVAYQTGGLEGLFAHLLSLDQSHGQSPH